MVLALNESIVASGYTQLSRIETKEGDQDMRSAKHEGVNRLVTTWEEMCGFLTEASCGRCEVLAVCLRRLQEDVSEQGNAARARLLAIVRETPSLPALRYHYECRRCLPAEMLATYLTPGEDSRRFVRENVAEV